jgi:hypothetical protein
LGPAPPHFDSSPTPQSIVLYHPGRSRGICDRPIPSPQSPKFPLPSTTSVCALSPHPATTMYTISKSSGFCDRKPGHETRTSTRVSVAFSVSEPAPISARVRSAAPPALCRCRAVAEYKQRLRPSRTLGGPLTDAGYQNTGRALPIKGAHDHTSAPNPDRQGGEHQCSARNRDCQGAEHSTEPRPSGRGPSTRSERQRSGCFMLFYSRSMSPVRRQIPVLR